MLSGGEAALLASHVIDDLVLPINCIDQQGRLALSMTAHSKALGCRRLNSIPQFLFVMGGGSAANVSARGCSGFGRRNAAFRITLRLP